MAADGIFGMPGRRPDAGPGLAGHRLLHSPDLLRLLGLLRHGHRPGPDVRVPLPRELRPSLRRRSVTEFWRRWHMSLSSWFRDYLYIPLGGNRRGRLRTYLNLLIVFLLCGLWHGASWNFVVWGLLHGAFLVARADGAGAAARAALGPAAARLPAAGGRRRLGLLPGRRCRSPRATWRRWRASPPAPASRLRCGHT